MSASAVRATAPPHAALRAALASGNAQPHTVARPASTLDEAYPIWRLLRAWSSGEARGPGPDEIVLLRQVLRWSGGPLAVGQVGGEVVTALDTFGARAGLRRSRGELDAAPFRPVWLDHEPAATEHDAKPELRRPVESIPAEPFLSNALRYAEWNSQAQKEAVWHALTAPARSTALIALPTGAGKSLCFQVAAQFSSGLTVVVVPTVALAIDHWRSAQRAFRDAEAIGPRYYAADDAANPSEDVIDAVERRRCRLLITSPEACVSGRLRSVLAAAASTGWLQTLVIDEAHLVDTWGMYFRVDFQVLAALRRQWLQAPSAQLRTLLLTATFTPDCSRMLRRLFAESDALWAEVTSQRLRPEISYYLRAFTSDAERERALLECVWLLPRPAILYTTTREDARRWEAVIRREGFRRVGCFHGDTSAAERRRMLDAWRDDQIDLMIATSAFGMGVDKSDVRSVVHACLPEDLHRYYQEVGRGGRDGGAATCVLIPLLPKDERVAEGLAPRLLTPETLQRRWTAMWNTAQRVGDDPHVWTLRTDAKPPNLFGEFTGQRNVTWNKRLLLQLARAGMLDVVDVRRRRQRIEPNPDRAPIDDESGVDVDTTTDSEPDEAVVRLRVAPHAADVGVQMDAMRQRELASLRAGLDFMRAYLRGNECVGRILRRMYGPETAYTCGGCPVCRRRGRHHRFPKLPLKAPVVGGTARRYVVAGVPSPLRVDQSLEFKAIVRRVAQAGYRRFVCDPSHRRALLSAVGGAWPPSAGAVYRVDGLDAATPLSISEDDSIAVMHVSQLSERGLRLTGGRRVLHLILSDVPYIDGHGRRPLELDDVPFFPSPGLWVPEA